MLTRDGQCVPKLINFAVKFLNQIHESVPREFLNLSLLFDEVLVDFEFEVLMPNELDVALA